jgi:L-asparaginase II
MSYEQLAAVWRGDVMESVHFGVAAIANAQGEILHGWGDTDLVSYPRSALKPVQALVLVESGAHRAYRLSARHLALACASHRGELFHTELAAEWLAALALDETALACGPDWPRDERRTHELISQGRPRSRLYHNCSGKHCGFLSAARHRGWGTHGYNEAAHPAQQAFLEVLTDLLRSGGRDFTLGVDGCTLPACALSVADMARLMARYAAARTTSLVRRAAISELHAAMREFPEYLSGTGQPGVLIARATSGRMLVKTGAEGFLTAFLPDEGLGIALKIADGNARARFVVLLGLLGELGMLDRAEQTALAGLAEVPVKDSTGRRVGAIRLSPARTASPTSPALPR